MVFHNEESSLMQPSTIEWPDDICTACNVVEDCADCQAATESCTDECFVQEEPCEECEPCFDESCLYADASSDVVACDMVDACCAAASNICTLEDCPGPSTINHAPIDYDSMHYADTGCNFPVHDFGRHCHDMATEWPHHFHHDHESHAQLANFFQDYCPDSRSCLDHELPPNSAVPSLSQSSSAEPSEVNSDISRRGSTCVESSMSIAAGMRLLYTCKADDCDQSFYDYMQLDQHILSDHLPQKHDVQLQPILSSTRTSNTVPPAAERPGSSSRRHHLCKWLIKDAHGNSIQCNMCFSSTQDLTQHIKKQHVGSRRKEYICQWAGCERSCKPFTQRQKIEKHLVVHTHDRPFKCSQCSYVASDDATLRQHVRTHSGERPFECPICHRTFSASTSVSVHMRLHTGEKPLVCNFPGCGKRFSESSNMTKHMRIHAPSKEFACDVEGCEKKFQRSDQLKRHKRTVHRHLMNPCCASTTAVAA